jgi:hypothetical protein
VPDVVDAVPVRSCVRRGAAIDLVLDRSRENRSQFVLTQARGRQVVFWQSARTARRARPNVALPTKRGAGLDGLEVIVDAHERYAWQFRHQQAVTRKRALPCGDYGVELDGRVVAVVERKTLADLSASLTTGRLRYALAELAALPLAAVVVEDRYSPVFDLKHVRLSVVAEALAECQARFPSVPVIFAETRALAQEWTYRFLAAALTEVAQESGALERLAELEISPAESRARRGGRARRGPRRRSGALHCRLRTLARGGPGVGKGPGVCRGRPRAGQRAVLGRLPSVRGGSAVATPHSVREMSSFMISVVPP